MRQPKISLWRSIWRQPSRTLSIIVHEHPWYRVLLLTVLVSISPTPWPLFGSQLTTGVFANIVAGALLSFGLVLEFSQLYIGGYLLTVTGSYLGGRASTADIQTVMAWANIPIIALGVVALLMMPLKEFTVLASMPGAAFWIVVVQAVQWLLVAWSFVIFFRGLAVVQGFSWQRAVGSSVAATVLVLAAALPVIALVEILQ